MKNPPRRTKSSMPAFLRLPWWVCVLLATLFYYGFKYLLPQLQFSSQALQNLINSAPMLAPIVAIVFLLLAAVRLYDTDDNDDTGTK